MPIPGNTRVGAGQFGPDVYADWRVSSLGEITEALEHRVILRLAGPLQDQSVLDVGCGDGTLVLVLASNGAARVAGCDLDPRMVARARVGATRNHTRIDLAVARCQALPFPDGTFDVVTCITVLSFVPDAGTAIREMARVLRPGGRLVIGDLGKWSVWAARRRIRGWLGAEMWRTARFRTVKELTTMAEGADLVIGSVTGAIFFPPLTALARVMAPLDPSLGKVTTLGAAFVAIQAMKP
jgi:ubiquinone/menaquinone biosynthesis C-methylase UbiE